ncbi:MAG: TonB-dependent receptor [Planctomycetota bacterium]
MKRIVCSAAVAAACLTSSVSPAGEEAGPTLDAVVVTARRVEENPAASGSSVTVIGEGDLRARGTAGTAEALRDVPGLDVSRSGSLGSNTDVFIRGGSPSHTLVLIDGVPATSPTTGQFNFGSLTAENIERVEVVRGPMSLLYGSDAVAGVIQVITKRGRGPASGYLRAETGAHRTFRETAGAKGGDDTADFSLSVSRTDSDGTGQNTKYTSDGFSGRIGFHPTKGTSLELMGRAWTDTLGIPGQPRFNFDPNDEQDTTFSSFAMTAQHRPMAGWDARLQISQTQEDTRYLSPPPNGFGLAQTQTARTTTNTQVRRLDWQNTIALGSHDTLVAGFEFKRSGGRNTSEDPDFISSGTYAFDKLLTNRAWYAANTFTPVPALSIEAGVRADDNSDFGSETNPRVTGSWTAERTATTLHASYGTAFRAPSINELVFPGFGNPALKPEENTGWDAGVRQALLKNRVRLGATYFRNHFRNLIQYTIISLAPFVGSAMNIGRAETEGGEFDAAIDLRKNVTVTGALTLTSSRDLDRNEPLRRRPVRKGSLGLVWRPTAKLTASAGATFTGPFFDDDFNGTRGYFDGHTKLDVSVSYDVHERVRLFGRVENLGNEHYEEAAGYPAPGIFVMGGVEGSF